MGSDRAVLVANGIIARNASRRRGAKLARNDQDGAQVPTKFQLADMLTKRLDPGNHQRLRRMILGHDTFDHRRYFAESNN